MPATESTISELIAASQTRAWPVLTSRAIRLPWLKGKIDALVGMRRVGKSSFCFQRMHELEQAGVERTKMLYMNFEDERLDAMSKSDLATITDVFYRGRPALRDERCYFFFDEIHNIPGWQKYVRRLLDQENAHICVTGSSAKMLSAEIATSLRGRALATEVFPFSFAEFLAHRQIDPAAVRLTSRARAERENALLLYLEQGGFPEVQGLDETYRLRILQEYADVVVLRDVVERHGVTNVTALRRFVRQLLRAPASLVSIHRLHNDLKSQGVSIGKDALHTFLSHLADAFLFYPVEVHSDSERVKQSNPRKIYVIDPGMLVAFAPPSRRDLGLILENFVFMELRRLGRPIAYVKTASGHEVDFLCDGPKPMLVQACVELEDAKTREREVRALEEAMEELSLKEGTIVTLHSEETIASRAGNIRAVPAWKWALHGFGAES